MQSGRELLAEYQDRTHRKQFELAQYLSLTPAHLSQIMSGKRSPGLPTALRIERLTGVPAESWLDNKVGETGNAHEDGAPKAHISE